MPRPRIIHPSFWEDKDIGKLSKNARLLFLAIFSNADDDGRISADPKALNFYAFRYDNMANKTVISLRDEISSKLKNFLVYEIEGFEYIQLLKWEDWQKQKDERRKPSLLPSPTERQIDDKMSDKCQTDVGQMSPQDKLSEVKLSKGNMSPGGDLSPVPVEKKKTIVELYCLAFEKHFKSKPYLREDGKIDIPKGEVMALQVYMIKRFGELKTRAFFTPDANGRIPIFIEQRIINDKWLIEKAFAPSQLLKKLIEIKNKQNIEVRHDN